MVAPASLPAQAQDTAPVEQVAFKPNTVPTGPYGTDRLVRAIASGNADAVQPALDAVKVAINNSGDNPVQAIQKVQSYFGSLSPDVRAAAQAQVNLTPQIMAPFGDYQQPVKNQIYGSPPLPAERPDPGSSTDTTQPPAPAAPVPSGPSDLITPSTNAYGPGQSFPSGFNAWNAGGIGIGNFPPSIGDPTSPPTPNNYGPGQSFPSGLGSTAATSLTASLASRPAITPSPISEDPSSLTSALAAPAAGDLPPELTMGTDTSLSPPPALAPAPAPPVQAPAPAAPIVRNNPGAPVVPVAYKRAATQGAGPGNGLTAPISTTNAWSGGNPFAFNTPFSNPNDFSTGLGGMGGNYAAYGNMGYVQQQHPTGF
jgi:hypothetical protein